MRYNIYIFGAGENGKKLYLVLKDWVNIVGFIDNCCEKQGHEYMGIPIISFCNYLNIRNLNLTYVVNSVNSKDVEKQLDDAEIEYKTFYQSDKFVFNDLEINSLRDKYILEKFINEIYNSDKFFETYKGNWFRESCFDETNKCLIDCMKQNIKYNNLRNDIYETIYSDELFENRPGMRLIFSLIMRCANISKDTRICDIGCGHGFLLDKIYDMCDCELYAFEGSENRVEYLKKKNKYNVLFGDMQFLPYESNFFDVVTCLEVLEHVSDVERATKELNRVLKNDGYCWITVPEGKMCDCSTHVRQFSFDNLIALLEHCGFKVENIQAIPAFNYSYDGHIVAQCRKERKTE